MPPLLVGGSNWSETELGSPTVGPSDGAAGVGRLPIDSTGGTGVPQDLQNFFPCGTAQPQVAQRGSCGRGNSEGTNRVPHSRQKDFSPMGALPQVGQKAKV